MCLLSRRRHWLRCSESLKGFLASLLEQLSEKLHITSQTVECIGRKETLTGAGGSTTSESISKSGPPTGEVQFSDEAAKGGPSCAAPSSADVDGRSVTSSRPTS